MIIKENFNLKEYTAYRLESRCEKAYFPETEADLLNLLFSRKMVSAIVLGNGNNTILSKKHYEEDFIILNGCFNEIHFNSSQVSAQAGATLLELSELALQHSLSGLEMFYDIPSSVGGAIVMNAGSSGEEIKDILVKVRYLDLSDLKIKEKNVDQLEMDYRTSFFQKNSNKLVLQAWFNLKPGKRSDIFKKMNEIKAKRWSKQPREYPNCGSVFKRPPGKFVGPMLDELGLKGFQIGGARISEKHSGFIINAGNATGKDILDLIEYVQGKVRDHFEVELEVEQRII